MPRMVRWISLLLVSLIGTSSTAPVAPEATATVDLGYTIQEGTLEATHRDLRYFNFTNIRYAAPPTGPNRFQPANEPAINRTTQAAGAHNIMCPQGQPAWLAEAASRVGGLPDLPPVSPDTPGVSEDCLFLDVLAPETAFRAPDKKVPVLVWIHGGGYVTGAKATFGSGAGLLDAAAENGRDVVFVAINYRMGLFGFLSGVDDPAYVGNLGLRDQQFALEWVQRHIHLFGGDKDAVTVLGESAGGGSILHLLTSTARPPFHRAITQSPYTYHIPQLEQETTFRRVLAASNASSWAELKDLPTEALQVTNARIVEDANPYGTFVFGPVDDGDRFPGYPAVLLAQRKCAHSIPTMAGYNTQEGPLFANPAVRDNAAFAAEVALLFPQAPDGFVAEVAQTQYPDDPSGAHGYADQPGRLAQVLADATMTCNAYFADRAAQRGGAAAFLYHFAVPPAFHGLDLPFTFFDAAAPPVPGVNATLARILQRYLANFAATGLPDASEEGASALPEFPAGHGRVVQVLNNTMVRPKMDTVLSPERCDWWQEARFLQ